jgi:hypothetical protein
MTSREQNSPRAVTHHCVVQRRWRKWTQAERGSGIGLKLFGFIAESVFTFIPESCSRSPRNAVRNHPGIAFTFLRILHVCCSKSSLSFLATLEISPANRCETCADTGNPLQEQWPPMHVIPCGTKRNATIKLSVPSIRA